MPIATLDSMKKKEEDGNGNEYYAGGAGAQGGGGSGLNVIGADDASTDRVSAILNRARQEGGAPPTGSDAPMVHVTFYANGFTVGEGPLREKGIPENDKFLSEVSQGFCPSELIVDGKPAAVQISDKRSEEFKAPPAPAYVAFSGGGQKMESSAPDTSSILTPTAGASAVEADKSQPTLRVQLVFAATRKRQVVTFNKTHTVRDLIATIDASGNVSGPYQMLTSDRGPPRPIKGSEFDKTLTDAGLAGAAVTVKAA